MKATNEHLTRRIGISVALALAAFVATLWGALNGLGLLDSPFDYGRFLSALGIGAAVSITGLTAGLSTIWGHPTYFGDKSPFTKTVSWLSVMLALDSLIVEPYLLAYLFPRLQLASSLRWQFQLIIAGLLALAVAISKHSWRWLPFAFVTIAFGILWLVGIFSE